MAGINWLERQSVPYLAVYLSVVGALAALLAWCLMLAGHFAFEITRPTLMSLFFAVLRGSFFALIAGFGLRLWWRSHRVRSENRPGS